MCYLSSLVDMDASDTVTITIKVLGEGSDVVDILGGARTTDTASFGAHMVA